MASPAAEMAAPAANSKWTVTEELLRRRKNPVTPPTSDDYKDWSLEQLRLERMARRLNVKKNTCKSDRMQLLPAYDSNKSGKEGMCKGKTGNRKRRKTSNTDTSASLAKSVAQIVAHDQSDAEIWKQQALLLRDQRMAHRLEMLTNVLNRTRDEERRLVQSSRDSCEEDKNVELILQQTSKKRKLLPAQINDLELEIINAGEI
ncbi:unnamed protein product [Phytophthora fragariaefolia]|uniref:Unnamed protein product n=1 Tax=Phytophthora fragariaefolia TaxID=1490495 RepID=A0A9W6Y8U9_9STRA|nr:unnamed protein product [Phytophthora fragariaefolia]